MTKQIFLALAGILLIHTATAQTTVTQSKKDIRKEEKALKKEEKPEKKEQKKEMKKLEGTEVSKETQDQFYEDFGQVAVSKWQRDPYLDLVYFTKDNANAIAYYDADHNLVGTVYDKTFADLPEKAQKYIDTKMTDFTKGKVIYYKDNELNDTDMILYRTQFDDADNYFIEMEKGGKTNVYEVTPLGNVTFFSVIE
ncbi:hypothetical protein [Chitinophaga sp. Cy-1792]|uniref:hypothetical protein n=1 Tax=Chitinophaga sp. Cy-1792 TaxID=2608339 RepID=UPI00141FBF74|nr:hypothetical protein [Chitinophaga sp. Cy-1792]NIG53935.1 hypothetical protein [Chitinophaga sp. Cy-1792]